MIDLKVVYPKPIKFETILENDLEYLWDEAKELVSKEIFNNNIKNREIMIDFIALELIDEDNLSLNHQVLEKFKNPKNIKNNWLKWSLTMMRDIKDINLVNSGIDPFSQVDMQKMFKHKQVFAKTYNINLREESLSIIYYKLFNVLKNVEHGSFNKYYDKFNSLPAGIKKLLALKDIESIKQLDFYIEVIRDFEKKHLNTQSLIFLFKLDFEYVELFNKYDVNLVKLLDHNILHSDKEIYKLIEYATNDKELMPLLRGFTKIAPGSFYKSIDPREAIEDQIATSGEEFEENGKQYLNDGDEILRIFTPDQALKKIFNEYMDVKYSPKLFSKNNDMKFTLEDLNIPLINGIYENYSFETYPLLTKDPITDEEIFNSEVLVRGMVDKDCTSSFKGNNSLGWELIEQLVAYPEDNAYVVIKDDKKNEIASMYVTKVQDSLIIDSIQYMKDLQKIEHNLNNPEDIKEHYHNSLLDVIREWAYQCSFYKDSSKAPMKIYLGEGDDGLRLTKSMRDEISIRLKDFSKIGRGKDKEKNFLTDIEIPHTNSIYNDFEGSQDQGNTRLLFTKDERLLSMKPVYETVMRNISNLPEYDEKKLEIDKIVKNFKKLNKNREEVGLDKYKIHNGIYLEEDSLKDSEIENRFENSKLFDIDTELDFDM